MQAAGPVARRPAKVTRSLARLGRRTVPPLISPPILVQHLYSKANMQLGAALCPGPASASQCSSPGAGREHAAPAALGETQREGSRTQKEGSRAPEKGSRAQKEGSRAQKEGSRPRVPEGRLTGLGGKELEDGEHAARGDVVAVQEAQRVGCGAAGPAAAAAAEVGRGSKSSSGDTRQGKQQQRPRGATALEQVKAGKACTVLACAKARCAACRSGPAPAPADGTLPSRLLAPALPSAARTQFSPFLHCFQPFM